MWNSTRSVFLNLKLVNNREVDFYLPDLNIALEVMGPHHFIYRESN